MSKPKYTTEADRVREWSMRQAEDQSSGAKGIFPTLKSKSTLGGVMLDSFGGLTKRELFAAMAMQGLLGQSGCVVWDVSEDAVKAADALIAELEKEGRHHD